MAHSRIRHLTAFYKELLGFSPLVGVLGHRQVGKTTFLEANTKNYLTFDNEDTLNEATLAPKKFIDSIHASHTVIDESQLVPGIFPALKERVRKSKRPGQITLSGSVRFTSRESIRESLTGRIQYAELLPFSIAELEEEPLPNKIELLLGARNVDALAQSLTLDSSTHKTKLKQIDSYLKKGGLPGICFIRKDNLRIDKILDQLRTILDRDLRQIYRTKLTFDELSRYLSEISIYEGKPYDYQHFKRATGLNPLTQKNLLYALEAIFLIRRIPIEGGSPTFSILFEDQAESHFFSEGALPLSTQLASLVYRCLRTEFFYRSGNKTKAFQFRNRSGSELPIAFKNQDSSVAFLFSETETPDRKTKAAAGVFLRNYANSKVIILHFGTRTLKIDSRILSCPITAVV